MFSWERVLEYFPKIIAKFPLTFEIVLVAFVSGFIIGCVIAVIRLKEIPILSQLATVYISYIRCTPVICQMFVIYFGLPVLLRNMGIDTSEINNVVYVFVAYGMNMGGFMGEIIRSSILAVPAGQMEAGKAVGLTDMQTMSHIIAPQALKIALPMLGNTFVALFQATALAYMVGVIDMIGMVSTIGQLSGHKLEGYVCCAGVFAIISLAMEFVFNHINKRLNFGLSGHPKSKRVKEARAQ